MRAVSLTVTEPALLMIAEALQVIDVVFGFDVEDPINENSDEALLRICRIFSEEGVRASLFTAGEKARVIRQRGRRDVMDAMRAHETCYHGNYWGEFPVPALHYGQEMTWDEAVAFALNVEAPGLNDVAEITGQFPVAWCVHQAQWCPQMAYALKLAGVRCNAGGPRGWVMNWLSWGRSNCTLSSQPAWDQHLDPTDRAAVKPPMDAEAELAKFQAQFDRMAETQPFITIVGHPTCWVNSDWGSLYEYAMLFRHGAPGPYPRPANIRPAQPRSPQDSEAAFDFLRRQIRWLKSRSDVNLTNFSALCDRDQESSSKWVTMEQLVSLAGRMQDRLNYLVDYGTSFSCADVLGMLTFACEYCWRQGRWPEQIPVQRLLGPTEPILDNAEPVTLTRENIFAGAIAAYSIMMDDRRVPGALRASMQDVGTGAWFHGLARFVGASTRGEMPLQVTVQGAPALPLCADEPAIRDRRFSSSNRAPGLSMEPLWEIWKRQAWSYRPAVPGNG